MGSFDEKGGFLTTLENRGGRTVESVGGVPPSGNSFLQRSISGGAESETHLAPSTLRSAMETDISKTLIDKPASPPLQPMAERDTGFSERKHPRDAEGKEPTEMSAGNSIPRGAAINSTQTASRVADEARLGLGQSKRAQVVILSGGSGTMDSIPTAGGSDQEIATSVASDRPIQQNSQWTSPNRVRESCDPSTFRFELPISSTVVVDPHRSS